MAPNISNNGQSIHLFFDSYPQSSEWWIYTTAGELVEQLQFTGVNQNIWNPKSFASGLYLIRVKVDYTDGTNREKIFKVVVIH